jgi:hypothetical protein
LYFPPPNFTCWENSPSPSTVVLPFTNKPRLVIPVDRYSPVVFDHMKFDEPPNTPDVPTCTDPSGPLGRHDAKEMAPGVPEYQHPVPLVDGSVHPNPNTSMSPNVTAEGIAGVPPDNCTSTCPFGVYRK